MKYKCMKSEIINTMLSIPVHNTKLCGHSEPINHLSLPPSLFVKTHLLPLTCPCMFMMTTVLERLHTTNCSAFLGRRCTLWTVMSLPALPPRDLNVCWHSVLFTFHTLIVPSELALKQQVNELSFIYHAITFLIMADQIKLQLWTFLNLKIKTTFLNPDFCKSSY